MSFRITPPPSMRVSKEITGNSPQSSPNQMSTEEWVEIVEPKSKTKIYANLDSGICAKSPPEGVKILKADNFDHWWELYDKKTAKYYYYNPEQQKTVWTKPVSTAEITNGSSHEGSTRGKLLIIPVSKLQTYKKLSPLSEPSRQVNKCDASTQTIASNLVTTGTQTFNEKELCEKLNEVQLDKDDSHQSFKRQASPKFSTAHTTSNRISSRIAEYQNAFKSLQSQSVDYRPTQDLLRNHRKPPIGSKSKVDPAGGNGLNKCLSLDHPEPCDTIDHHLNQNKSSLNPVNEKHSDDKQKFNTLKHDRNEDGAHEYFGPPPPPPPPVSYQKGDKLNRMSINVQDNTTSSSTSPHAAILSSTSTFKNNCSSIRQSSPNDVKIAADRKHTVQKQQATSAQSNNDKHEQKSSGSVEPIQPVATNNLTHYLVREARAMGIALISDDELEDDDQDSDDEFANDDDEDTDLRDDASSIRDTTNAEDSSASQELAAEGSESSWRPFSDQESPNVQRLGKSSSTKPQKSYTSEIRRRYVLQQPPPSEPKVPQSPISCKTTSFRCDNNELIDDQKDPASCMSQQLDHRKLVENFKKTRQTSALGFNDSLSRSYKLDANNAVQRLKTVADTYFNNSIVNASGVSSGATNEQEMSYKTNDKYLRHLSTLSTLPRPIKTKPPQVPQDADLDIDADYDVVEENCSYYSDSERRQAALEHTSSTMQGACNDSSPSKMSRTDNESATPLTSHFDRNKSTRGSTFSVESFARENLTRHPKKGGLLFNRKVKWSRMISWTKNSIKQPMISSVSSDLTPDVIASFKLIQQFMGDRKITLTKRYRQLLMHSGLTEQEVASLSHRKSLGRTASLSASNTLHNSSSTNNNASSSVSSNVAPTSSYIPDRLRDELAYELTVKGCVTSQLRDEIFVQTARQLTDNPSADSTTWGLVLMSILLNYFSPSSKFAPFLLSFLETHQHQMARDVCLPRLEKRLRQNWPSYCRKPADGKEISIVRLSITKWPQYCGVFGESLERIMSLQACSSYLKTLRLPWILTTLGDKLLETGGPETEGIFRCAADHDLLAQLRLEIDCVDFRKIADAAQLKSLLSNVDDPHVIAGLLKLFFRQLCEPVFPARIYDACLLSCNDAAVACRLFDERLPNLNKDVVAYLIRLLQFLSESDKVANTKMDTSNLSMVWAPNLLRAPESLDESLLGSLSESRNGSKWSISNGHATAIGGGGGASADEQAPQGLCNQPSLSQSMIFEQTRQEMQFLKLLMTNLDTSFIENVL